MSIQTTHTTLMNPDSAHRPDRTPGTVATVAAIAVAALVVVGQLYATIPLTGTIARDLGTTSGAAVWTSTAFGFAYAVGMLVAGPVSDAVGRRRVAVAGLLASSLAALLVSLAPSFALLLTTRVIQGAAAAFFAPVALAYLTERIAPNRRSVAVTTVIGAFLAAAVLAPFTSLALSALGGWRTWFYASAAGLVILAVLLWRVMLPDDRARTDSARTGAARILVTQLAGLPRLLARPRLAALYLATLTVMFAFVGMTALAQLAGPGTAGHPEVMQWVRLAALPACVVVPIAATALSRIAAPRRVVGALAVFAIAAAVTGLAGGPVALTLGLGAVTIGIAAAAPALVETVGASSRPERRGAAIALYGFMLFVGASLAAPAATALAAVPFAVGAGVLAAAVVIGLAGAYFGTRATKS